MADQSISQLPVATSLTGEELTVVVQNSVTKQTQVANLTLQAGYLRVPTVEGDPVDTPVIQVGNVPMVFDTLGNKLFVYNDGWHSYSQD